MNDKPQFHSAPFSDSPQERGNPLDAVTFNSRGQVEPATDGNDSEACISKIMARYNCPLESALETMEDVTESTGGQTNGKAKDDFWKIHALEDRLWIKYKTYVKNNGNCDLAHNCCLMILGYQTAAGAASQSELVKLLSEQYGEEVTKAAVNKCLKYFKQKMPELPFFKGQRGKSARKKMSVQRNNQLTN